MSQSASAYLNAERNAKLAAAKSITDKAEAEGRSLAVEEKQQIEGLLKEAEDILAKVEGIAEEERLSKNLDRMIGAGVTPSEEVARPGSIGDAFVKSQPYQDMLKADMFKGQGWRTGPVEVPLGFKESVPAQTLTTVNSDVVQPDVLAGVRADVRRRLTVADLIPQASTNSNAILYVQEQPFDDSAGSVNSAAFVAETNEKPVSRVRLEEVTEPVRLVAAMLPVSNIMLEDVDGLRGFLDNRLRGDVQHAEEAGLLNGDGNSPNLSGILDRTGLQTGTQASLANNAVDAVFEAIVAIQNANSVTGGGYEPTGIVVNPTDWAGYKLSKDLNEQYYGGGPFTGPYGNGGIVGPNMWELPVVVTSLIAAGTVLVGAFNQAQIFRRSGLVVEASNSHNDFFQRNMTMIRAEERLALAVYAPAAFFAITSVSFES